MRPEPRPVRAAGVGARAALALWSVVLLVVCARSAAQPTRHNLYPTYSTAGGDWLAGADLYTHEPAPGLDQFRYSPVAAALMVPLHVVPERAGNVLWRLLNAGVLLGGFAWWLRAGVPGAPARRPAVLFLLLLPLSLGSLNNGQPNALLAGLLLLTVTGAATGRWNVSAAAMAAATALKVYPLALGLLVAVAYPRRFGWRLGVGLAVAAALPFCFQHPAYVCRQYGEWYEVLRPCDEARRFWPAEMAYRDLWLLLRVWGVPMSVSTYQLVQVLSGLGCAALCLAARWRGLPARAVLTSALTLASCWMMLCGPATESCTYALFAPALAWGVLAAWEGGRHPGARCLGVAGSGLLLACVLAGVGPGAARFHALALHPLGTLLFLAGYLASLARSPAARAAPAPAGAVVCPAGGRAW